MTKTQTLLAQAYFAFNHRDIDSALALMTENVSWPKASEGGRVVGKESRSCRASASQGSFGCRICSVFA